MAYVPSFSLRISVFTYLLIKLTQINDNLSGSNSFISMKLVSYSAWFVLFMKRKISITFNAKENTWHFERLEQYLEREIQVMLISFEKRCSKKIFKRIFWLKVILQFLFYISLKNWMLIRHIKNWKHLKSEVT